MKTYPLTVITHGGKIFEQPAVSLIAPGSEGSLGILAGHTAMVVRLGRGALEIKTPEGGGIYFAMDSGILEVDTRNNVLVLADLAVKTENRASALQKAKEWPEPEPSFS